MPHHYKNLYSNSNRVNIWTSPVNKIFVKHWLEGEPFCHCYFLTSFVFPQSSKKPAIVGHELSVHVNL